VDVDEKTDRDRLQAVGFHRLEALAVARLWPPGDAEHHRLRGAVDVRVKHAHRGAFRSEREGEIHRGSGFADAAFARSDGDDVLDARHQLHAALHGVRDDLRSYLDQYRGGARLFQCLRDLAPDRLVLAFARLAELDIARHVGAGNADIA